ncbi:MAG: hypothetical protein ACREMD_05970 [Gemmatimonadota bacterium]
MSDRMAYPGRGGRVGLRSSRFPAAAFPACLVFVAVTATGLGGCGKADGRPYDIEELPSEELRLTGSAPSLDDLLLTFEVALVEHDTTRLLDLMITEREYREILYPAFPAAHPPINARFETLWVTHYPDARRGLMRLLRDYGGRDVPILDLRFERPDQDFVNFVLHETSRVDAEVDGVREDDLRLFGSVVRVGDQWKILSYPDG